MGKYIESAENMQVTLTKIGACVALITEGCGGNIKALSDEKADVIMTALDLLADIVNGAKAEAEALVEALYRPDDAE